MTARMAGRLSAACVAGVVGVLPSVLMAQTSASSVPTITCHELLRGVPTEEAVRYSLRGNDLYRDEVLISQPELTVLSEVVDKGRRQKTWASHKIAGDVVERSVFWEDRNGKPRLRFVERYDFKRQTVIDAKTKADTCHHNGR